MARLISLFAISSVWLLCFSSNSQAGILFNRGCNGGNANASCLGHQASGCHGHNAGCNGLFGRGLIFNRAHRRVNHSHYSQPSAPVVVPAARPMPKLTANDCIGDNCVAQFAYKED